MSKFTFSSSHLPCPVCEDTKKKCRILDKYVLCMALAGSCKGEIVNGYKNLGLTKDGLWAQFALDNSEEWSEERQREWLARRAVAQAREVKQAQDDRARALSPDDRDKFYRQLLDQLDLHPQDRIDLEQRGFTPQEIEQCGFKSVKPWQRLKGQFPVTLPGIKNDGQHLAIGESGYLCPVHDIQGRIVSCQLRLREPGEGGRYRWLSTPKNATLKVHPDGCDIEGELPLAIFRPEGKPKGIALVEGTGPKPFLASQRLNLAVVGAAGGQWASNPVTLKNALDALSKEVEANHITIYPDAGDLFNELVMRRWKRLVELLKGWGYQLQVAWWEQFTKDSDDIDELSDYAAIGFIEPEKFYYLSEKALKEAATAEKERLERLQREAEDNTYRTLTTIQEKPWKEVDTPKLNLEELELEPGAIYVVSSAKGTCKTKSLIPLTARTKRVLAWFNRIALGREECNVIGLTWKNEPGSKNKRGFCSDSAPQFDPRILSEEGLLIVDECDQVFAHNFGSTCNKDGKRPLILATLEAHLRAAIHGNGKALFMSADVTQKEIDYVKSIAPIGCPVRFILNHHKPQKGDLIFDTSDKPDGLIEDLLMQLEEGKACFVIDDIKNGVRGCKSIAEYVRTVHPEWANEIIEIHSDTSGDPLIMDFIKNVNEASMGVRLICCSPSIVSGISIENGRFNEGVYGFFNGVLTINEASQALSRVRGATYVNVWSAEEGLIYDANGATTPQEIKDWYVRNYQANCHHLLSFGCEYEPISNEWSSPHFALYCQNSAYRNLCMSRLRERMKERLIEEGYRLHETVNSGSDAVENELKQGWGRTELAEAYAIAAANILSDAELDSLQAQAQTTPLTPEEQRDIQKTLLFKSFGEELIEATTFEHKESGELLTGYVAMALKNNRDRYRRQLEAFYYLTTDPSEVAARDMSDEARQLRHNHGRFPGDIRWRTRQAKARQWLGLPAFLDNPEKWHAPKDYASMCEKAKSKPELIKDCLGLSVEKIESNAQIFAELFRQIGLTFEKEWASERTASGHRFRLRKIDPESWRYAQMYCEYRRSLKAEATQAVESVATEPVQESPVVEVDPVQAVASVEVEPIQKSLPLTQNWNGFEVDMTKVATEVVEEPIAVDSIAVVTEDYASDVVEFCDSVDDSSAIADLVIRPDRGIRPNDVVRFLNPSQLEASRIYEGVRMRVTKILEGLLIFCQLPDGSEKSFGINTLQLVT